jgi:uncharacterized protein (DUF2147 family)
MKEGTKWLSVMFALIVVLALAAGPASAADSIKPDMGALKGRWVRPDGGYIIAITNVDGSGKMEAAYYNPKPINVSKAQATREGGVIKVFIELRGPGYPGSTYTLTYDPKTDELSGIYYQAVMQQNFEVVFVRTK